MKRPNVKNFKYIIKTHGYDLTKIDISGVPIAECDLRKVKLRKDKDLFQKIDNKNLYGTLLPEKDFSRYNFNNVLLKNTKFQTHTILPRHKNLFQKIRNKDISFCNMPCLDYTIYNFTNVCIKGTVFPDNSLFPMDYSIFQKIKYKDCRGTKFPNQIEKTLHLYDLRGVKIDLNEYNLSFYQKVIILLNQLN